MIWTVWLASLYNAVSIVEACTEGVLTYWVVLAGVGVIVNVVLGSTTTNVPALGVAIAAVASADGIRKGTGIALPSFLAASITSAMGTMRGPSSPANPGSRPCNSTGLAWIAEMIS